MRVRRDLMMILAKLSIILFTLTSCNQSALRVVVSPTLHSGLKSLPGIVAFVHSSGDAMDLTWYRKPFSGAYDELMLRADGVMAYWTADIWAIHGPVTGQLSEESRQEIKTILEELRDRPSNPDLAGSMLITLSFSWQSDSQVVYFSNLTCTDELRRLIQIAGTAFSRSPEVQKDLNNLCESEANYIEPTPAPTVEYQSTISMIQKPNPHGIRLFTISWPTPTAINESEILSLYSDNSFYYSSYVDERSILAFNGHVNSEERVTIRNILAAVVEINIPTEIEKSKIILSFPWEGDYHIVGVDGAKCPENIQRLFDLAESIFKREVPENSKISNPCGVQ